MTEHFDANLKGNVNVPVDLADGRYDILCGYGRGVNEGKGVAANLSDFDVVSSKARVVDVETK